MKEPVCRRVAPVRTDRLHGSTHDEEDLLKESFFLEFFQVGGPAIRMDACSPKHLVGHPIAHPRKIPLVQEESFERALLMAMEGVG
jgi:hypothetical protein